MMYIDGDVLEVDIEMDLEEVKALHTFIKDRLDYVEEIVLQQSKEGLPLSSSLFALLFWIKQKRPSIKIEWMDAMKMDLQLYGMMNWVSHE